MVLHPIIPEKHKIKLCYFEESETLHMSSQLSFMSSLHYENP